MYKCTDKYYASRSLVTVLKSTVVRAGAAPGAGVFCVKSLGFVDITELPLLCYRRDSVVQ